MQIHSLSKALSFPFVLMGVGVLYYSSVTDRNASIWVLVPVFFLVSIYVFHGLIDHWWLTKFPIQFDPKLRDWLERYFPFYNRLDDDKKSIFEKRMGWYLDGRMFASVGKEQRDVPEDIKCMIAAHGIAMNMGKKDYLIGDVDRIYLYKHPFPTPMNHKLHTVETNLEDGVIILSLEQVSLAIVKPLEAYNVAYHAYAEIYIGIYPKESYPDCTDTWAGLEKVSGLSKETILLQTGLEVIPILPVHITLFFSHQEAYKQYFPLHYERFSHIFQS